ncbi:hypothetical protein DFJ73DRAFT_847464 [Zopfochytrium polystomum]|nr:hypothetical protein DFJ73DRAFT_847464 [Zopfochytrium polystomum]
MHSRTTMECSSAAPAMTNPPQIMFQTLSSSRSLRISISSASSSSVLSVVSAACSNAAAFSAVVSSLALVIVTLFHFDVRVFQSRHLFHHLPACLADALSAAAFIASLDSASIFCLNRSWVACRWRPPTSWTVATTTK